MRQTAHGEHSRSRGPVLLLVTAGVLFAGYAALTRYDPISGPPEAPLEALQAKQKPPVASTPPARSSSQAATGERADALTESISALVAAEKTLPAGVDRRPAAQGEAAPPAAQSTEMSTMPPLAAPRPSDVITEATTKVAEAEALLRGGDYPHGAAQPAAVLPAHQQRAERISRLRSQLAEISAGTSSTLNLPPPASEQ